MAYKINKDPSSLNVHDERGNISWIGIYFGYQPVREDLLRETY